MAADRQPEEVVVTHMDAMPAAQVAAWRRLLGDVAQSSIPAAYLRQDGGLPATISVCSVTAPAPVRWGLAFMRSRML